MMRKQDKFKVRYAELLNQKSDEILKYLKSEDGGNTSLAGWFLGPKGENGEIFKKIINQALDHHIKNRQTLFTDEPKYITDEIRESVAYKETITTLEKSANLLFETLKQSVPFWSYRYQSHMLWDTTLPGMIGYFAAMLYNQNNVAAESSPVTTILEKKVGEDLCEMLGYNVDDKNSQTRSWGHITCDGSIANNEAMWAARNLKYYPISISAALKNEEVLISAQNITVSLPSGATKRFIDLNSWQQFNLKLDDVLAIPKRMQIDYNVDLEQFNQVMELYSVQNIGFEGIRKFIDSDVNQPVVMAPSNMHYSWPKSAAVLGFGANHVRKIYVDLDARMRIDQLQKELERSRIKKHPIIMVIAVIGSTEESAVDPLKEILLLRTEYNKKYDMDFIIHCDAAWGGYFTSILRKPKNEKRRQTVDYTSALMMNDYVTEQYQHLSEADSITLDPHKSGYVQYPAGGLCYRNSAMRNLVTFTSPVIYHGGIDPTVGVYGLEGSKPGAAPAGVYLSHQVIPLDQSGYGKILGKCLFNSKRLYSALVTMVKKEDEFILVPFQRLPAEKKGKSNIQILRQLHFIEENIVSKTNAEILRNTEAVRLLHELGSDQVIISYAFNFKTSDGSINTDTQKLNRFNENLFNALSIHPDSGDLSEIPFIVTQSSFTVDGYGEKFVEYFKARLGVSDDQSLPIKFLISTTMDPFLTETEGGNFIPVLIDGLRKEVKKQVRFMQNI